MINKTSNKINEWSEKRVHSIIKKGYKRKFKKPITSVEINKIWNIYLEEEVVNNLKIGAIVNIDKQSKIWVKATPTFEHKRAMSLFNKGLMYSNGVVKDLDINFNSSRYIYKIVFETDRFNKKTKLFFKPHSNLRNAAKEGIKEGTLITRLKCQ